MKRLVRALTAAVAVASFFAAATAPVSAAERWTRAEAAEQYLSAVCPVTLAAGRVATLVSDPTSTHEDLTAAARQARNATWRSAGMFLDNLHRWPTGTRSTASRVADAIITNNRAFYRLSLMPSKEDFIAFYVTNPFSESSAPQRMRLLLRMKPYWVNNAGCASN